MSRIHNCPNCGKNWMGSHDCHDVRPAQSNFGIWFILGLLALGLIIWLRS